EIYRTYHMTNPDVFYNKEDLWSLPTEDTGGTRSVVEPYYVIMKLPGGAREEFILMQPMTPSNRSNMVAWLAAPCDPPEYGARVEYEFPKERLIYGPADRGAHRPGHHDLAAALALEPDGLEGDPREPAGDPGRG